MSKITVQQLLNAGVHFGHLRRKWNPQMAPYIFMEKNGIHIIDLNKTVVHLEDAANALKQMARSGKKILFVGTKKQAKDIIADKAKGCDMPYVTERWPGGMLTNFQTIRKTVKKMSRLDSMVKDGTAETLSKKERLVLDRTKSKLEKDFGSIADLNRLPAAIFIVDIKREHIAVAEAKRLNIPTFGMVDTNSNPNEVDFAIPANDDAADSVALILDYVTQAIREGLADRKASKDADEDEDSDNVAVEMLAASTEAVAVEAAPAEVVAEVEVSAGEETATNTETESND
ncbi:MAG: 30S ribosomal protein S2 [Bacteroidetes bacterium]|nr:30S ribosomal protein S2 [Bacteroidota bacterium]